jgi:hypothetical protein
MVPAAVEAESRPPAGAAAGGSGAYLGPAYLGSATGWDVARYARAAGAVTTGAEMATLGLGKAKDSASGRVTDLGLVLAQAKAKAQAAAMAQASAKASAREAARALERARVSAEDAAGFAAAAEGAAVRAAAYAVRVQEMAAQVGRSALADPSGADAPQAYRPESTEERETGSPPGESEEGWGS